MHQNVSNSGIFEFLRIAFSLLVPLSLRYLIDYVERAELAEAAKRAAQEAASSWGENQTTADGGGLPDEGSMVTPSL